MISQSKKGFTKNQIVSLVLQIRLYLTLLRNIEFVLRCSIELFEQFRIERKRSLAGVSTKKFSARFKIVILGEPNSISEIEIS